MMKTNTLQDYDKIIKQYLTDGIVEEVPDEEADVPCRYLPHHGVVKSDSLTTKLSIVFNGSAKCAHDKSVNDACLVVQISFQTP